MNLITLYLIIKELNRSKQLNFKFIQNYVDSLKWIIIRCSNVEKTIESWLLSNLFLLNLNESLELYIFNLIQSIKINKFELLIDKMTIILVDHDKWANEEKNLSFKSMMTQFNDKKRKFENNSEFQRELKKCTHCEQEDHSEQSCWLLHLKLRSDEWKSLQKRKNLIKENDFEKSFEVKIVRTMKIFIVCWVDNHIDVWWINIKAENHVCYDINLFDEQSY